MTLDELLECDSAALDKLTPAECEAIFAPYFNITRPTQDKIKSSKILTKADGVYKKPMTLEDAVRQEKIRKGKEIAAAHGIKL